MWWESTSHSLVRQRQDLVARAAGAPWDLPLQVRVLDCLERVQERYVVCAAAAYTLCLTAVLAPEQLAEVWVTCWPYMSGECGVGWRGGRADRGGSMGYLVDEVRVCLSLFICLSALLLPSPFHLLPCLSASLSLSQMLRPAHSCFCWHARSDDCDP